MCIAAGLCSMLSVAVASLQSSTRRSDVMLQLVSFLACAVPSRLAAADAYERLILDCINGDRRLFIRNDELEVAWEKFTPVLKELEERGVQPELYPYGSRGPVGAHYLAAKHGVRWGDLAADDE